MEFAAKSDLQVKKYISLIIIFLFILFYACKEGDDFSTDKNLTLAFSENTISFDTVFSTIGSTTKQFKIYNRNKNSLRIESIELVNASKSGFRMNIDGEKGTRLTNIEILKKDSLYGFVEVTIDPTNTKNPLLIRDSIRFVVNGNTQYVQLEAVGQDVYIWKNKVIKEDTTLTDKKPFLIYDSLVVNKDATLSIKEGAVFFMKNNASIKINGILNAQGTMQAPIIFRGSRFDNIEADIPYNNVPGQWEGIVFHSDSYNNSLKNVVVKNTTRGITFSESDASNKKAILKNIIVQNSSEYGLQAVNCNIDVENGLFANSGKYVVSLSGGEYSFLHCTLANYYRWSARQAESLLLNNTYGNELYPLSKCDFTNSIIFGSVSNEILLKGISSIPFVYGFHNCLIKGTQTPGSHYIDVIWNSDPQFKDLNSAGIYSYNFELQSSSPAIGKADKAYSSLAPLDLKGKSRLSDSGPDIGCYEN
ncbi:choice-of-anchor Q domain-containing protein [Dysgonomonas sp.]